MKLRKLLPLFVLCIHLSPAAYAAPDWEAASLTFIDDTVVPAYAEFINASQSLMEASDEYCHADASASTDGVIEAYHQAADTWQGIQIFRSGPAQLFNRHSRIQTWPGVSNIANKQMRQLLAEEDEAALEDTFFRKSSTTLQGFPALERLLFAKSALVPKSYACQVVQTIAKNLRFMGEQMQENWSGDYKQQIKTAGENDSYISSAKDVAAELLTDFYTQVYAIGDQKLGRPYAKSSFRYKRAESWRSHRSLRNIRVNIEAADAFYKGLFMPAMASSETDQKILDLFDRANQIGLELGDDFKTEHENNAELINEWRILMTSLRKLIRVKMPIALDIPIGFNALDGDG